jgi:hypothetical protein
LACDFSNSSSSNIATKQEGGLTAEDRANSNGSSTSFTGSSSAATDYGTDTGTATTSASDRGHDEGYCDGDCGSADCAAAHDAAMHDNQDDNDDDAGKSDVELESELRGIAEDFASDDLLAALQQAFDDGDDAALAFDSPLFDDDALMLDAALQTRLPSPEPVSDVDSAYASAVAAIAGSSSSVFRT